LIFIHSGPGRTGTQVYEDKNECRRQRTFALFFSIQESFQGINVLTSFNIGLSILSSDTPKTLRKELLSTEGRRILSLLDGHPIANDDILRGENGRPYFSDRAAGAVDFNISHSGIVTAVSLVKGSNIRTGCDVQLVQARAHTGKITEDFFSGTEREYILSQDKNKHSETRFFEIWTLKECFLKLRGLSVFDMAKAPSFISVDDPGRGHFAFDAPVPSPLTFYLYELTGCSDERYMLAVAIEGESQAEPVIQWFSESSLPCMSVAEIQAH
jgi:phosphopantetheinyl transferase